MTPAQIEHDTRDLRDKYQSQWTPEMQAQLEAMMARIPQATLTPAQQRAAVTTNALGADDHEDPNPLTWTLENRAGP